MSRDYIEWKCEECGETPNRLNKIIGIPNIFLCDKCASLTSEAKNG